MFADSWCLLKSNIQASHASGPDEQQVQRAKALTEDLLEVVRAEHAKVKQMLAQQQMELHQAQVQYAAYSAYGVCMLRSYSCQSVMSYKLPLSDPGLYPWNGWIAHMFVSRVMPPHSRVVLRHPLRLVNSRRLRQMGALRQLLAQRQPVLAHKQARCPQQVPQPPIGTPTLLIGEFSA